MSFRTYFEVEGPDRSDLPGQVAAQRARVRDRLSGIRHVVAVMSGKGGVGKSHVTALLAHAAGRVLPGGIGVLDADLRSPTVARLLGARGPLRVTGEGVEPATGAAGVRVMSTDLLLAEGTPLRWQEAEQDRFLWRGILETGALREFLADVRWGPLDLLLVDLPPGADGAADLVALVPQLAGAVAVTIPSEEAARSVTRAMRAASDAGIRLLGIVENMSGYACDGCGELRPLFAGDAGPRLAEEFEVPLLGKLPFSISSPSSPSSSSRGDQEAERGEEILQGLLRALA